MKMYHYVTDMPEWAQKSATKAVNNGYIKMDKAGAVNVWECNPGARAFYKAMGLVPQKTCLEQIL